MAIVGEFEPTGMAKHVWVDRERLATALPEGGVHFPDGVGVIDKVMRTHSGGVKAMTDEQIEAAIEAATRRKCSIFISRGTSKTNNFRNTAGC